MNKPLFKPDYSSVRNRVGQPHIRAISQFLFAQTRVGGWDEARQRWRDDKAVDLILRGATDPAATTTVGWADTYAPTGIGGDLVISLAPTSASAAIRQRGMQVRLDGKSAIVLPNLVADATGASWVVQGAPIPVRDYAIAAGPTLLPTKLASISVFSREIFEHSTPLIELVVRNTLAGSIGAATDAAMLDDAAADTSRPAGLRNGIAALTASAATPASEALAEDVADLVAAVAGVAANSPIMLVASPKQAARLRLWMRSVLPPYEVLASSGLADGVVVAIASNAVVSASNPLPRFDVAREPLLHMDTEPTAIGTAGTPPTVAAPTRSLFQTDTIALRLIMEVSWGLLDANGVAWMESTTW